MHPVLWLSNQSNSKARKAICSGLFEIDTIYIVLDPLEGTKITVRVGFSDVYHVYLSDQAIQKYYFAINDTNEVTGRLLQNLIDEYNPTLILVEVDTGLSSLFIVLNGII